MRFLVRLAIPLLILAASADITMFLVTLFRIPPQQPFSLEAAMTECRNKCVAQAAEGFVCGEKTGCACTGTLP